MAVKEFKREERCEYIIPRCPKCNKMLKHVDVNLDTTESVVSLKFLCKRCDQVYHPGFDDIAVMSTYPPSRISFIDEKGSRIV